MDARAGRPLSVPELSLLSVDAWVGILSMGTRYSDRPSSRIPSKCDVVRTAATHTCSLPDSAFSAYLSHWRDQPGRQTECPGQTKVYWQRVLTESERRCCKRQQHRYCDETKQNRCLRCSRRRSGPGRLIDGSCEGAWMNSGGFYPFRTSRWARCRPVRVRPAPACCPTGTTDLPAERRWASGT